MKAFIEMLFKAFFGITAPGEKRPVTQSATLSYEIHVPQYKQMRDAEEPHVLLDVRETAELQIAQIAGAIHIPMGEITMRANQELDPEAHIVVMCHHGVRSMSVTNYLRQQGFERAQSLAGGIDRWAREIDPTVRTY